MFFENLGPRSDTEGTPSSPCLPSPQPPRPQGLGLILQSPWAGAEPAAGSSPSFVDQPGPSSKFAGRSFFLLGAPQMSEISALSLSAALNGSACSTAGGSGAVGLFPLR